MEDADKKEIQKMIDLSLAADFSKRVGDTPTDALQLTPKHYVDDLVGVMYEGFIDDSAGVNSRLPEGWTVVNNSTGVYTVTHNLGTSNYSVVLTAFGDFLFYSLDSIGTNSFVYHIFESTLSPANRAVSFMLKLI